MGKYFDYSLQGKSYTNEHGKKITGSAFLTHFIKQCGGLDEFANQLYEGGLKDGILIGMAKANTMMNLINKSNLSKRH